MYKDYSDHFIRISHSSADMKKLNYAIMFL